VTQKRQKFYFDRLWPRQWTTKKSGNIAAVYTEVLVVPPFWVSLLNQASMSFIQLGVHMTASMAEQAHPRLCSPSSTGCLAAT
jgi:hypothetical protein